MSHPFVESLRQTLIDQVGVSSNPQCSTSAYGATRLGYGGYQDVLKIGSWVYSDSSPDTRCERKYQQWTAEMSRWTPTANPRIARRQRASVLASDVPVIRRRLADGESVTIIAAEYGVSYNCIYNIKSGVRWGNVS